MGRDRLYIPAEVQDDIRQRVREAVADTLAEFDSAEEDEDVLTGHLGGKLTTRDRKVYVPNAEAPGMWTWSLRYRKFRGRGPKATEKLLGADGILELNLDSFGRKQTKSLLFQSKMGGGFDRRLVEQCAKLSNWREASAVFVYSPEQLEAMSLDRVLHMRGDIRQSAGTPLDTFISDVFVACKIGDTDLRYIPDKKELIWKTITGETVATKFQVRHRLRVNVKAPPQTRHQPVEKYVDNGEIHKHRMDTHVEDLLHLPFDVPQKNATDSSVIRQLAQIFHPDLFTNFSPRTRELVELRLKEFNAADKVQKQKERARRSPHHDAEDKKYEEETPSRKGGRQIDLD